MRKLNLLIASVALSIAGLVNAAQQDVNVYYYNKSDLFITYLSDALRTYASDYDYNAIVHDGIHDPYQQSIQLDDGLNSGNPLLVNLVDRNYGRRLMEQRKDESQRIIFFNRRPIVSLEDFANTIFIGGDGYDAGVIQAQQILDYIKAHRKTYDRNGNGNLDIIFLKGEKTHQETEIRTLGIINTLRQHDIKYNIVAQPNADWSFDLAFTALDAAVSQAGLENIDMIVSNNDAMALGAVSYLGQYGYNNGNSKKYIPVYGIDGLPEACAAIERGQMEGSVLNDYKTEAQVILQVLNAEDMDSLTLSRVTGYKVGGDRVINIPFVKVDKNSLPIR